jgi:hypothetical protein
MSERMQYKTTRVGENGRIFRFMLWHGCMLVDMDGNPHAEIEGVDMFTFEQEVERFMSAWNWANHYRR